MSYQLDQMSSGAQFDCSLEYKQRMNQFVKFWYLSHMHKSLHQKPMRTYKAWLEVYNLA